MELWEEMRQNDFEMNLVEEYCERYCAIDREVVWYGSMDFFGKEDAKDNLMRMSSWEITVELLGLTKNAKGNGTELLLNKHCKYFYG
ncbi:MAG: hypothetical protein LUI07_02560 [Lachnospiraceae bacterium]|nr:hypothetical protein [Lachnospiraceae bacterium]